MSLFFPDYDDLAEVSEEGTRALGRAMFVGEVASLAGIPAGLVLRERVARILGVPLEQVSGRDIETGFVAVAARILAAVRTGASAAYRAARAAPTLTLGLASIGGLVLQDVLEPDADVIAAEQMSTLLAEQLDRLPAAERSRILESWGRTYAGLGGSTSIPWGWIGLGVAALVAWKVLR